MKKYLMTLFCSYLFIATYAQPGKTDRECQEQVAKLNFMVGEWEGEGWRYNRQREKVTFQQTEKVQFKLDSTLLLVEGLGKSNGKIVHNALAIITFNKEEGDYDFRSSLSDGKGGNFKGEVIDNKFYWYPNENMRYIISLDEEGKWLETGEFNNDGQWFQFFEMALDKKE